MVQILNPQPNESTLRQQALADFNNQIAGGINNFINSYQAGQDKQAALGATKRQQALEIAKVKLGAGVALDQNDVNALAPETVAPVNRGIIGMFTGENNPNPVQQQAEQPMQQSQTGIGQLMSQPGGLPNNWQYTPQKQAELAQKQNAVELQNLQLAKEKRDAANYGAPIEKTQEGQKMLFAEQISARKAEREAQQKKSQYQVPGFELADPNYTPTQQDLEKIKTANKAAKDMTNIVNNLAENVAKYGISTGTGVTEGGRAVDRDISALVLAIKNAETLGALSASDIGLATNAIGRLQGTFDAANPFNTPEDAVAGLQDIINKSNAKVDSEASSRGFRRVEAPPRFINPYAEQQSQPQPVRTQAPDPAIQAKLSRLQELRAKAGIK